MQPGIHPLAQILGLEPHPEGGWYRQTWASPVTVTLEDGRVRPTATLIYFLLPAGEQSQWHRVGSDELWMAHTGVVGLQVGGRDARPVDGVVSRVGMGVARGQRPQVLVPAGVWQRTLASDSDALVSCMVSPGFSFDDFELARGQT